MRTVVVHPSSHAPEPSVIAVAEALAPGAWMRSSVDVADPAAWLVATPDVLVAAAPVASASAALLLAEPHTLAVLPDAPWVGVLCCHLAARPRSGATVVVAGSSSVLRWLATAGAVPSVGEPGSQADWELCAYRSADLVVATSTNAQELLRSIGVTSALIAPASTSAHRPDRPVSSLVLAEHPGRPAFPDLARWLNGTEVAEVAVPASSEHDVIHVGATLEVAAPWSGVRVRTDRRREKPDAVLAADPLAWPAERTQQLVARGVALIARAGSPTALAFPGAATFHDRPSLRAALEGRATDTAVAIERSPVAAPVHAAPTDRARAVSAVVPVYRDVRWLADCVSSLLAQTEPLHEILLVDDGSDAAGVTAALAEQQRRAPDRIVLLTQPNGGVCRARNLALEQVTGDAVVMVDSDDELEPTFVERTATVLRNRPELVAVATWTAFFGTYSGVEAKPPFDARVGRRENPIVSTCVLLDRAVLAAGVRFVPELADVYCEDWEFWAHIVALGGRLGLVAEPLVRHRVHPASGGHKRTELALDLGRQRATAWLNADAFDGPLSR